MLQMCIWLILTDSQKHAALIKRKSAHPAPEPDLIDELSKGNVPSNSSCNYTHVATSLHSQAELC